MCFYPEVPTTATVFSGSFDYGFSVLQRMVVDEKLREAIRHHGKERTAVELKDSAILGAEMAAEVNRN